MRLVFHLSTCMHPATSTLINAEPGRQSQEEARRGSGGMHRGGAHERSARGVLGRPARGLVELTADTIHFLPHPFHLLKETRAQGDGVGVS